jgi:hypothetical protein
MNQVRTKGMCVRVRLIRPDCVLRSREWERRIGRSAVLGFIALPSRLIESAIAASVIVAALNNLYPVFQKRLWIVAFVFGLVHGLGFANVLTDLALPKSALAVSLVSFNLGVEAGQLALVAAFLPLVYGFRRSWLYPRVILGAGSLGIAAIASVWLIERSLDVSIFS